MIKKHIFNYLSLLLVFAIVGCEPQNPYVDMAEKDDISNAEVYRVMEWVLTASPKIDAYEAFKKGDHKFYLIQLHHRLAIPIYEVRCPSWRGEGSKTEIVETITKRFKGSVNANENYEQRKLAAVAMVYVEEYNSIMWFHLNKLKKIECIS